ncbi:diguanylate cyclase/phosphodiesterase [Neorhizobium alkalisoli]|uniref:Diguanylate cyclase/phosphodiesterase n=2 Tax=Neorhizobium alkalisoli TaxID=528178 RepID=A0A561QWM2_9HYPH|nr:diguanylate cyclase/phosphodiesterase [Neorhizobium alkalisoli]
MRGMQSTDGLAVADDDLAYLSQSVLQREVSKAFRPIVRGFMLPVVAFYTIVIIPNFLLSPLWEATRMSSLSLLTALAALVCRSLLRSPDVSFARLEAVGAAMLLLIYANCCNVVYVLFQAPNLIYFLLLFIVTAAVAVSIRLIVAISLVVLATMLAVAYAMSPEVLLTYAFASVAAALAAGGLAIMTRGAVMKTVRARLLADRLRSRAEVLADHDALTGLPNRRCFFSCIEKAIARDDAPAVFHLALIDLDGFKPVNDLYGHAIGDELLVEVARRIRFACAGEDMVSRLGGDEFAIAVSRRLSLAELEMFGARICETLRQPFVLSGIRISVTGSIGIAHYPENGRDLRQIYERADHALYRAKRDRRGRTVIFSSEHEAELSGNGRIEQALRTADLDAEFSVMFQPQHDLMRARTTGFEALARWNSPILGFVGPQHFIAAAERCGLIEQLTAVLLRKALSAAAGWPEHVRLSVNLSALDLMSSRSIDDICRIVGESGFDPERLTFEITETSIMHDIEKAKTSLDILSGLGCRIALDDFGSGYSSFAYIHRLPLNRIKMDRNFVTRLSEEEKVSRDIIRAIAELCANLGVECLAEGVETESELMAVRLAGVRYIQGYYFGRPQTAADALAHLEAENGTGQPEMLRA